jgi:GNAT superfamily N-acetyltransferase
MRAGDEAAAAELAGQLGYPTTAAQVGERLRRAAGQPDAALLVAEAAAGRVVGWAHAFGVYLLESEPYAELGGLVVDERERGRGVGRALLAAVEGWAREGGFASVRLRSNVVRERAHAFYERLGYERVKTQHCFRRELRDPGADSG